MDRVKESNCGIRLGGTLVNNLRFADDIDLIDEDYRSLQEQLEKTRVVAEQARLIVNVEKTKTMVFGGGKIEQEIQIGKKRRKRRQVRISREPNNLGQQLLRGNKKMNREGSRSNGIAETRMEWQEVNRPEQTQNPDSMSLQRTPLRLRDLDPEGR